MTQQSAVLFTDLKPDVPGGGTWSKYERLYDEWEMVREQCARFHPFGCYCPGPEPVKPTCGFCASCGAPAAVDAWSCDRCGQSFMVDSVFDEEDSSCQ